MVYLRINLESTALLSPKGGTSRASTVTQAPPAGPSNHPAAVKAPAARCTQMRVEVFKFLRSAG